MTTGTDTFETWLKRVDLRLLHVIGLSYQDLPDRNWRDEYDSGMTPREAADEALADEGFEGEEE